MHSPLFSHHQINRRSNLPHVHNRLKMTGNEIHRESQREEKHKNTGVENVPKVAACTLCDEWRGLCFRVKRKKHFIFSCQVLNEIHQKRPLTSQLFHSVVLICKYGFILKSIGTFFKTVLYFSKLKVHLTQFNCASKLFTIFTQSYFLCQ